MEVSSTDQGRGFDFPEFNNLTRFSYGSEEGPSTPVSKFIDQNSASLHSVKLQNRLWRFPSNLIAMRNIRHLDLLGSFFETRVFHDILSDGEQLEFLSINCELHCAPSYLFRKYHSSLPALRHFSFSVSDAHVGDGNLFPALMEFVQKRTQLKTLRFVVDSDAMQQVGFDAVGRPAFARQLD
jgi:hypothetical protein